MWRNCCANWKSARRSQQRNSAKTATDPTIHFHGSAHVDNAHIMSGMRKTAVTATLLSVLTFTASAAEVGKPTPALTIQQLPSGPAQLSQYKGKVVALALINTTCPHCQNLT